MKHFCVSPIINGQARESIFFGQHDECKKFVTKLLQEHPEYRGNLIVTPQ